MPLKGFFGGYHKSKRGLVYFGVWTQRYRNIITYDVIMTSCILMRGLKHDNANPTAVLGSNNTISFFFQFEVRWPMVVVPEVIPFQESESRWPWHLCLPWFPVESIFFLWSEWYKLHLPASMQIYGSTAQKGAAGLMARMSICIECVASWMSSNRLRLISGVARKLSLEGGKIAKSPPLPSPLFPSPLTARGSGGAL